ncbi:MAG: glycosyltransferase [Candidatus Dormibacteraeota bacterium]|nr:glycosyltransferase [Candidatus Dormibacteraeota bacterium]
MASVQQVTIAPLPPERYEEVLSPALLTEFQQDRQRARAVFEGRTIWNVNSTASGGGVAEMLRSLIAYAQGAGVDARWAVIGGTPDFFAVTKRIHNHLHGFKGDGGPLGADQRRQYEEALAGSSEELSHLVGPRDIVLLHDPQTAGLIPRLKALGVPVVWRCHVGIDEPGDLARNAWNFLIDDVRQADAYIFSRRSFVWAGLEDAKTALIMPSIDAFSPKNRELDAGAVEAILAGSGLVEGATPSAERAIYLRQDGTEAAIEHRATLYQDAPLRLHQRTILQVSRWDSLKDPLGVITGFAEHVAPHTDAHLVYAGPAVEAVSDDPEGKAVLEQAITTWRALPRQQRERIHLATLPMDDGEENAAMVNALQRHSYAVVQKSTAEGFGLTVAEAMWKARPVVASRIGGIQDQIEDGRTGILLQDPADLLAYGRAVVDLLEDSERARTIGEAAQERVRDEFLGARSLVQYMQLLGGLISG